MIRPIIQCSAGLDVHQAIIVCTVLTEQADGEVYKQTREYPTFREELKALALWLAEQSVELAVMESTGVYWRSLYDELEKQQILTYVVNARHIKQVPGRKTDVLDSEWLAELGRCGLLRNSFIPPLDLRQLRMLTRYRQRLVGIQASEKNRLHKVLDEAGILLSCVVTDIDGVSAREMIAALIDGKQTPHELAQLARGRMRPKIAQLKQALVGELSDRHRLLLQKLQGHLQWLEAEREGLDEQIVAAMQPYRESWQLLQTMPGIDQLSAAMLVAEIGVDMSRFGSKEQLSSWAGLCPGNHESAGKRKSGRTRQGNRYVKRLLCETAHSARRTHSQFKGFYQGLVIRRGHKRAIMAVAHKQLEIIYILLKKQQPYIDPKIDYEAMSAARNAPRWIKVLKRYGYWPQPDSKVA